MKSLKKEHRSAYLLCHFLIASLVFPVYKSIYGTFAGPDYILACYFALRIICSLCYEDNIEWKKKDYLGYAILLFLLLFNRFALRSNMTYHGWYLGQLNLSIAVILFLAMLFAKDTSDLKSETVVRFVLYAVSVIAAISLIPGLLGYTQVRVGLTSLDFVPMLENDPTYCWVFEHKSEYSFLVILFIALSVTYRRLYKRTWQFWASIGVYAVGLVIANTRVTMLAALFILAGVLLDGLIQKSGGFQKKHLLLFVPFILVGIGMLAFFSRERDIFTLGYRTYIWSACLEIIQDNPDGVGAMLGLQKYPVEELGAYVSNCHNVFMNSMMHFSKNAGLCCVMMAASIAIAAILKNRSFRTVGIIIALLIPLNMDWCLTLAQVPLALVLVYFIFFHPLRNASNS